ncbi:MAG: alpha-L-fucosidase, partial [Candidatus Methylacidiphilales bacterium]|nr:alpha-L-fucosidase [Candidatus Methylacidiphilales bacterium]
MKPLLAHALVLLILASSAPAATPRPVPEESGKTRMQWWREARFGMFIHWGLYAVPAGEWR